MRKCLIFLLLFSFSMNTMAMRAGYSKQLEAIFELLPFLKNQFSKTEQEKIFLELSVFPKQNIPIDKLGISNEAQKKLEDYGILESFQISEPESLPILFELLVESLKKDKSNESAVFIAAISYNTSTAISPLYSTPIYFADSILADKKHNAYFKEGDHFSLKKSSGTILESAIMSNIGSKRQASFISSYKPTVIADSEDVIYQKIAAIPFQLIHKKQGDLSVLLKNINMHVFNNKTDHRNGQIALVKLGQHAQKATADIIHTAYFFAKHDIDLNIPPRDIAEEIAKKSFSEYKILNDAFVGPIFKDSQADAKVGIIVEPEFKPFASATGKLSGIFSSAIAQALTKAGIPYKAIDIRTIKKLPKGSELPLIIFPSHKLSNNLTIKAQKITRALKVYAKSGGKILSISDTQPSYLKELSKAIFEDPDNPIFKSEKLKRAGFSTYTDILGEAKSTIHALSNLPLSEKATFQTMSYINIKTDDNIKPLVSISNRQHSATVAALLVNEGNPTHAFFTSYSLMPTTVNTTVTSVFPANFDNFSDKLFTDTVKLMTTKNKK